MCIYVFWSFNFHIYKIYTKYIFATKKYIIDLQKKTIILEIYFFYLPIFITMPNNNEINFIELQTTDIPKMKEFYGNTFGWDFTDFGDGYSDIKNAGINWGFAKMKEIETPTLAVLYHENLEAARTNILKNGAEIILDIFSFPGGRRFEFLDPSWNRLAVWSDT